MGCRGMRMEIVFNELSARGTYQGPQDAQKGMHQLVQVARAIIRCGADRTLRTTSDFMNRYLAQDYRVAHWLNDKTVDKEERLFVKTVAGKAPFLEECFKSEEDNRDEIFEFLFENDTAHGLGVAYLWEAPAVSLDGEGRFAADPILILLRLLGEDNEFKEEMVEVCCLTTLQQVSRREPWIRNRVQGEVRTGTELWKRRESLFTSLTFCSDAQQQLQKLNGREPYFRQVLRHLFELDHYVAHWRSGPFALAGISWSEESGETLQHPEYGPMRRFHCPDGVKRTFSFHTKPTGGNVRIHFFPLREEKMAYVAYVGPHLPTVRYKT